jgi:hypothetical protein
VEFVSSSVLDLKIAGGEQDSKKSFVEIESRYFKCKKDTND